MDIDHIAIAVPSIDGALAAYKTLLGAEPDRVETVASDKITEAMVPVGGSHIQLLEPTDQTSTVAKFLDRRGPGLHHIAIRVDDLDAELDRLRKAGTRLIDEVPRRGGGGHRVAFVHPSAGAGVLIELVEHAS